MDKELFESYVVEASNLRQQVGLLLYMVDALTEGDEFQFELDELVKGNQANVEIREGKVYVNPI